MASRARRPPSTQTSTAARQATRHEVASGGYKLLLCGVAKTSTAAATRRAANVPAPSRRTIHVVSTSVTANAASTMSFTHASCGPKSATSGHVSQTESGVAPKNTSR